MEPGQTYEMSGYEFKFLGTRKVQGPNYVADEGRIELWRNGEMITELNPQKRIDNDQNNPMTEASIDVGLMRDLYSALGEPLVRHPLVAKGYPSIGCLPCTTRVADGEDERDGRWRGKEKTECGIHLGLEQIDMNGADPGLFNGDYPDCGALESDCP